MDELLKDFLVETAEALAALDNDLVRLEAAPNDKGLISSIFRTLHTIKGTSGFLGLTKLGRVAHAGENVLGRLRDGTMTATPEVISTILRCVDAIKSIIVAIETGGGEGPEDYAALLEELDARHRMPPQTPDTAAPANDPPAPKVSGTSPPPPQPVSAGPAAPEEPAAVQATAEPERPAREPVAGIQTIRVGVNLLETLITSVSELVLTRNQLLQILRSEKDSAFATPLQHLSLITSELQESVMKTRMQPIGNVWSTLPRMIRDLSRELGKKIQLEMEGSDTELDRQVLELIKDPLTHIIRNGADHGIESPADRIAAGKPEMGTIRLNAFHEGGHIIIEITDDGRGLDADRIRRKAIQEGLTSEAELAMMSDAQVFHFILRPGFSTAATVTAVSGRGVGMDVVRVNVEKIGGTIDVSSTPGRGARFMLKIPLTLAIVSALIVGCSGTRFALPQISVVELVNTSDSGVSRIQRIGETAVLRLRDRLLPLINLRHLLRFDQTAGDTSGQVVIVIQAGALRFGLIVDHVYDTEEIVVKPVAPVLKGINVYSGNTILGDGSVCMIIDPNGVAHHLGQADLAVNTADPLKRNNELRDSGSDRRQLLLVRAGEGIRKAIPLDEIARLEEVEVQQICHSGGQMLVHYRDRLMSLVLASPDLMLRSNGSQPVLVFNEQPTDSRRGAHLDRRQRRIGLVVDQILDITESNVTIEIDYGRPDILGSAIVDGQPTDIINVSYYLGQNDEGGLDQGMYGASLFAGGAQHTAASGNDFNLVESIAS
ncbi:chemotaxis protein CheA [Rhodopila globiformis]|nr:chemotaxis protein CheA [Rhodopila globiformis]